MKKLVSFLGIACLVAGSLQAQTFVSTTPSNRNAVIEEYTGIYCQYCPDGHKRVNQLIADNPGRVFAINVHQGGYAAPGAGDPDFRTQWGDALANQTGLTGYPAATVNRQVFEGSVTSSSDRSKWGTWANTVMGQSSPVNIAAQSTIDFTTRTLTVDVEVYYTGNSTATSNFINVALLQDSVLGPQTGGSTWNPGQMVGSQYRHMHILRHFLTGQWGDEVTTTTAGTFVSRQYTYTIPEHLNMVPYLMDDLEVIVYIAEGHQKIITGAQSSMQLLNEANYLHGFASLGTSIKKIFFCQGSDINSSVKLQNTGNVTITSAHFSIALDGTVSEYNWTGSLALNALQTINIPTVQGASLSGGNHSFTITMDQLNGAAVSPSSFAQSFEIQDAGINPVGFSENFSGGVLPEHWANPTNLIAVYPDNKAAYFNCYGISAGVSADLIMPMFDFRGVNLPALTFSVAHAQYTNPLSNDRLRIRVSTDCGATWQATSYDKKGSELKTANATSNAFIPTTNQWRIEYVALPEMANKEKALVQFYFTSDYGNIIWIDNVTIGTSDIEEMNAKFAIYPNPVTDNLTIESSVPVQRVEIFNLLGQLVKAEKATNSVDVAHLSAGIYTVKVTTGNGVKIEKIVKK